MASPCVKPLALSDITNNKQDKGIGGEVAKGCEPVPTAVAHLEAKLDATAALLDKAAVRRYTAETLLSLRAVMLSAPPPDLPPGPYNLDKEQSSVDSTKVQNSDPRSSNNGSVDSWRRSDHSAATSAPTMPSATATPALEDKKPAADDKRSAPLTFTKRISHPTLQTFYVKDTPDQIYVAVAVFHGLCEKRGVFVAAQSSLNVQRAVKALAKARCMLQAANPNVEVICRFERNLTAEMMAVHPHSIGMAAYVGDKKIIFREDEFPAMDIGGIQDVHKMLEYVDKNIQKVGLCRICLTQPYAYGEAFARLFQLHEHLKQRGLGFSFLFKCQVVDEEAHYKSRRYDLYITLIRCGQAPNLQANSFSVVTSPQATMPKPDTEMEDGFYAAYAPPATDPATTGATKPLLGIEDDTDAKPDTMIQPNGSEPQETSLSQLSIPLPTLCLDDNESCSSYSPPKDFADVDLPDTLFDFDTPRSSKSSSIFAKDRATKFAPKPPTSAVTTVNTDKPSVMTNPVPLAPTIPLTTTAPAVTKEVSTSYPAPPPPPPPRQPSAMPSANSYKTMAPPPPPPPRRSALWSAPPPPPPPAAPRMLASSTGPSFPVHTRFAPPPPWPYMQDRVDKN